MGKGIKVKKQRKKKLGTKKQKMPAQQKPIWLVDIGAGEAADFAKAVAERARQRGRAGAKKTGAENAKGKIKRIIAVEKSGFKVEADGSVELVREDGLKYLEGLPNNSVTRVNADFFLGQQNNPFEKLKRGQVTYSNSSEVENHIKSMIAQIGPRGKYAEEIIKNVFRVLRPGGILSIQVDFYEVPFVKAALEKTKFSKVTLKRMTNRELQKNRSPTGKTYAYFIRPEVQAMGRRVYPQMENYLRNKSITKREKELLKHIREIYKVTGNPAFSFNAMPWKLIAVKPKK